MLAGPNLSATPGSYESMGTITAEPQAVPEKKMRSADDASSVESEDETNAITSGPDSGGGKSHTKRSEEARARKNAKDTQPQRARKASISVKENMAETDAAQEAVATDGSGKCENSSEHPNGPN